MIYDIHELSNFSKNNIVERKDDVFSFDLLNFLNESSIISITDVKGKIIFVNDNFCKISQYSKDELIGQNHSMIKSGFHEPYFYKNLWDTISKGKIWVGNIKNKAKDGSFYWVRTTIKPTFDNNHNIQHFLSIKSDITSEINLQKKLIQKEKLSSIGMLSSRIAHDIRNPLSVISVSVDNLEYSHNHNKHFDDNFSRIHRSIERITHQIDDVLNFVNERPVKMQKIRFFEIISNCLDSIRVPSNIKMILPKNNELIISCDKRQFTSVISNLILNSIQAIGNVAGEIKIRTFDQHDNAIIEIEDSGIGIPTNDFNKIFDMLYTTKEIGTGLGLSSVKSILKSHGGIISVSSPPTIFTISLPKIYMK